MFLLNPKETRVILIGASEFEDEKLPPLPAIKDNNVKLRRLLHEVVGISKDNIRILEDRDYFHQITLEVNKIATKDLDIIYYAGHGLPYLKQLYLATKKTEFDDPKSSGALLANDLLQIIISKGEAKRIIFIIDCCYSGFARENIDTKGKEVFLLTSTSSTKPAKSESPENDNYTAFTHELLTILEQGIEGAGEILTIQDIFSGLKERLASKNLPLPLITSYGLPNELGICKNQAYQKISPEEYSEELENTQVLEKPAQVPKKSHSSLQLIFGTTSIILLVSLLFYINLYTPEPNKKTALPGTNEETALPEPGSKETAGKIFQDRLKDGSLGPEMVWIPAGTFQMGDLQGEGDDDEQPVHRVSVNKFAMGRHEITLGEFRKFVNATDYQTDAKKGGSCWAVGDSSGKNWRHLGFTQNDNHPVVCVSWNDVNAYARWLSQQTEQNYRLPTEAEWEYAARAGTNTKYWWGNKIGANKANCNSDCKDNFEYTAPVGSFMANPFGLYDTVGNVWEWTCSEYEVRYQGKEKRCVSDASLFVLRGGSWNFHAWGARAANRSRYGPANRFVNLGVRLARQ